MGKVWRNGKISVYLKEEDIFMLLYMDYRSPIKIKDNYDKILFNFIYRLYYL